MAEKDKEPKIFSLNRIKYLELYQDAVEYIKASYKAVGQKFNTASPFGQLLQVVLHLGRMIFYYIEDSITGLNIRTAYRPDQVKGLAMLAGHDAARPISARGAVSITANTQGDQAIEDQVCYIPNKSKVINNSNGYTYTILFGAENGKIIMRNSNKLHANIIQGIVKLQSATSTGKALQSFNFAERNYAEVDQYYINVYVNGEIWERVDSILDLGYNQRGCVVKTGINSGLDIFFGNGDMGEIPVEGASIVVEYIVSDGQGANIPKDQPGTRNNWKFDGQGMLSDGTPIELDKYFTLSLESDVIFGTNGEDLALTQLIAPHVSRSFVLANETNYRYFFKRMNMFSDVEIIRGTYNVNGSSVLQLAADKSYENYVAAKNARKTLLMKFGAGHPNVVAAEEEEAKMFRIYNYTNNKLHDNTYQDNTIYILLIPDLKKRISPSTDYFSCDEKLFYLSEDEQENIINLINTSGQRIITLENRIIQPKIVRFAINAKVKIWENYDEEEVYSSARKALSDYFLNLERHDMIPISDIVSIFENNVTGIDSTKVWFSADVKNEEIYGKKGYYGIDEYGDIILTRTIVNSEGQSKTVRDIVPMVRGNFIDVNGVEYKDSSELSPDGHTSAINIIIDDKKSVNRKINLTKYTALT